MGNRLRLSKLWSPSEITTLGWWDADDAGTITESGGFVSQWDDKSGNDDHMVQATAADQPQTGVHTLGGLNTISAYDLATGGTFMNAPVTCGADFMFFCAMNLYDGVFSQGPFQLPQSSGTDRWGLRFYRNNNLTLTAYSNAGADLALTTITGTDNPMIWGGVFDGTGAGTKEVFIDGTSEGSNAYTSTDTTTVQLFRNADQTADTRIGEVVIVPTDVSTATRQRLEGYLAWKWGLEGSLPLGHPYKNAAPTV